jgi:hypothetical protein
VIPDWWKNGTATVELYRGSGSAGPMFAAAVELECNVEDKVQLVRSSSGEEVVSSTVLRFDLTPAITAGSRVTVRGRTSTVVSINTHTTTGWSSLEHQEVFLK